MIDSLGVKTDNLTKLKAWGVPMLEQLPPLESEDDLAPRSEEVLRERRKALDWVIGVEADWDEVPSDT
jgi:hypothetical protein